MPKLVGFIYFLFVGIIVIIVTSFLLMIHHLLEKLTVPDEHIKTVFASTIKSG